MLLLIVGFSEPSYVGAPAISVGVVFPLSSSTFGIALKQGLLLSLYEKFGEPKEIDQTHLVYEPDQFKGVSINLYLTDDHAVPQTAEILSTNLLTEKKVVLIIGSGNSNCTARVRDVGVSGYTAVITPMSSATRLTTKATADFFFRLQAADSSKMAVVARRLIKEEKVHRLAIFYEDDEWYGDGLRDDLIDSLHHLKFDNFKVFQFERNRAKQSLQAQEKEVLDFNPDGAALLGLDPDVVAVGEYLNNLKLDIPAYFTGDNEEYLSKIPLSKAYALAMVYYRNSPSDIADRYRESFKQRYGQLPGSSSAHGYDAGTLLALVLGQLLENGAESSFLKLSLKDQRAAVAQKIKSAHFDGLLGMTAFDDLGNANYRLNVVDMDELRPKGVSTWPLIIGRFFSQHLIEAIIVLAWTGILLGTYLLLRWKPTLLPQVAAVLERADRAIQIKDFYLIAIIRSIFLPDFVIYTESVIDRWMVAMVRQRDILAKFDNRPLVKERLHYVQVPVKIGNDTINRPDRTFFGAFLSSRNRYCLEIVGEGGAGKTALACQIARWGLHSSINAKTKNNTPFPSFLPIVLDFDLLTDQSDPKNVNGSFLTLIGERLSSLLDDQEGFSEVLIKRLLRTRRIMLIVDRLSELQSGTASVIFAIHNSTLVNSLVITTRRPLAANLGRDCISIEPLRIDENHLLPFLIDYVAGHALARSFTDQQYQTFRQQVQDVVGSRQVTALFVTMYADVLLYHYALSEPLDDGPRNLCELVLAYIHKINCTVQSGLSTTEVITAAKGVAWLCLERTLRPGEVEEAKLENVVASTDPKSLLQYLANRIRLLQAIGPTDSRFRFSLEPIAEYLAAMHKTDEYKTDLSKWNKLIGRATQVCSEGKICLGFLKALRDVLSIMEHQAPSSVLESVVLLITEVEQEGVEGERVGLVSAPTLLSKDVGA